MEPVFGFMKAILGFTRMSVRGLNKVKRELGFVLMALNIRKVVAQRAENNQKFIKDNFYIISIEIVFFTYPRTLCPGLFYCIKKTIRYAYGSEKVSPLSKNASLRAKIYIGQPTKYSTRGDAI